MRSFSVRLATACLLVSTMVSQAFGCATVVIGKKVSPTGYVIVGHNEDDGGRMSVRHGYVPAAKHEANVKLPAEEGRAAIPQEPETLGFYWSQVKGAEGGMSNADVMLNECGVLLVSNSCASSREDTGDDSRLTEGGIEYNLRRVVAERAKSARDGVDIVVKMLDHYGYAPSGRTYTIADKDEGWMVQIVSGKHYVAARIPDDEISFMPNHYTIHDLKKDAPYEMKYPEDLIDYAAKKGWYDSSKGEFNFAKAYQAEKSWNRDYNNLRQRGGLTILLGRPMTDEVLPFTVKPGAVVPMERVKAALRTHYEGTDIDVPWERAQFPGAAPHDTTIRRVCTGSTVESTVTVFAERPELTTLWTAFGHPCTLPYVPMHPLTGVLPESIISMEDPAQTLEAHLLPDKGYANWSDSTWQALRDFQSIFDLTYKDNIAAHRDRLWSMENGMSLRDQATVAAAAALFADKKDEQAKALLADADTSEIDRCLGTIADVEDSLYKADVKAMPDKLAANYNGNVTVLFRLPAGRRPLLDTLRFGLGFTNVRTSWAAPIDTSEEQDGEGGWYMATFSAEQLLKSAAPGAGTFDCWLGGRDSSGMAFGGACLVTVK